MQPTIVGLRCFWCNGSGRVDHRDAIPPNTGPATTTMEAHGENMVDCPHCGGLGAVPGFKSLANVEMAYE